jgi:polyisoprenoid-binding protein YceI
VNTRLSRRRFSPFLALPFAVACGTAGDRASSAPAASTQSTAAPAVATSAPTTAAPTQPAAAPTTAPQPTTAPAAAAAPAGPVTFRVVQNESKATFRVREQLAGRQLPNDAVGTTGTVTGQLAIAPDGTFSRDASKISVDMRDLKSDSTMRDNFIKQNTLRTSQFPTAEFVPVRAEGVPTPLPASGEHTFKLHGQMTVKGVQKDVTWDVTAKREGPQLTGKATTSVKFGDFGMEPPRVGAVLSIVDEIRLELDLVAQAA